MDEQVTWMLLGACKIIHRARSWLTVERLKKLLG